MPIRYYFSLLITVCQTVYGQTSPRIVSDTASIDSIRFSKPNWVNASTQLLEATFNHPKMSVITNSQGQNETIIEVRNSSAIRGTTIAIKRYKGSIFFFDEFCLGQVRIANGQLMTLPLRYNLLKDQITILINNREVEVYNARFVLNQHTFIPLQRERGYVELLHQGQLYLLKKFSCELVPLQSSEDDQLKHAPLYNGAVAKQTTYWLLIDQQLKQVELSKASLAAALGHTNKEFDAYLANEVSIIDESILIYLLKAYEESRSSPIK